jgi:hypothetical protein
VLSSIDELTIFDWRKRVGGEERKRKGLSIVSVGAQNFISLVSFS